MYVKFHVALVMLITQVKMLRATLLCEHYILQQHYLTCHLMLPLCVVMRLLFVDVWHYASVVYPVCLLCFSAAVILYTGLLGHKGKRDKLRTCVCRY